MRREVSHTLVCTPDYYEWGERSVMSWSVSRLLWMRREVSHILVCNYPRTTRLLFHSRFRESLVPWQTWASLLRASLSTFSVRLSCFSWPLTSATSCFLWDTPQAAGLQPGGSQSVDQWQFICVDIVMFVPYIMTNRGIGLTTFIEHILQLENSMFSHAKHSLINSRACWVT